MPCMNDQSHEQKVIVDLAGVMFALFVLNKNIMA